MLALFIGGYLMTSVVLLVMVALLIWGSLMTSKPSAFLAALARVLRATGIIRQRVSLLPANLRVRPSPRGAPVVSVRKLGRGHEEVVVTEGGMSLVVSNTPPQSFCYEIPGVWQWSREEGALQQSDDSVIVAVCLLSPLELRFCEGDDPCARAATHVVRAYQAAKLSAIATEVRPFVVGRLPAVIWMGQFIVTAELAGSPVAGGPPLNAGTTMSATKLLVDIGSGWVAQLTHTPDLDEPLVRHLIETFGTTPAKEGMRPLLRDRYPELLRQGIA